MEKLFRLLLIGFVALSIVGCGDKKPSVGAPSFTSLEDTTALYYYGLRAEGRLEEYVSSMQSCEGTTPEYKARLVEMLRHHQTEIAKRKGGVAHVEVLRKELHDRDSMANVFLAVTFQDSTREEIMLPLVFDKGQWKPQ